MKIIKQDGKKKVFILDNGDEISFNETKMTSSDEIEIKEKKEKKSIFNKKEKRW